MWLSTTKLAKRENVTSQTIRRWIKEGKYERIETTKGGHIRIWIEQNPKRILYARVSSKKQESSLIKQEQILRHSIFNATSASLTAC